MIKSNALFLAACIASCLIPANLFAQATDSRPADEVVSFSRQIRPLLSDNCFACHGPDEKTREAGLRLDLREDAIDGGAITAGSPEDSELLRRITLPKDDDERMPPLDFHKNLSPDSIELMRRWIKQGAPYEQHWAYRPIKRPAVAAADEETSDGSGIDSFIDDSLKRSGLKRSPEADAITLVRRLHLDLVGIPPSETELQEFLNGPPETTFENTVDRLLGDPRFGERLAVYWLDLVRFADTIGYHSDNFMEVSAYRDYVIRSFNENKPFDEFTIEQLAGDLLPDPNQEQLVASGYNRLLQTTEEGGAQAKEYVAIYAADRVRSVSGVWMGQTVGCAQCHDHKYDPFTTRDFYSLGAFFADIDEKAVGKRTPNYTLITSEQQATIESLEDRVAQLQIDRRLKDNADLGAAIQQGQRSWEMRTREVLSKGKSPWITPAPASISADGGVTFEAKEDGSFLATGETPEKANYIVELDLEGPVSSIRLETLPDDTFAKPKGFSRSGGNFVLSEVKVFQGDQPVEITGATADYEQGSWPITHTYDGNARTGWAIDGHHKQADRRVAVFRLHAKTESKASPARWRIELHHQSAHTRHLIGRLRISVTDQTDAGFDDTLSIPDPVRTALHVDQEARTTQQSQALATYYRTFAPELATTKQELADAKEELKKFKESLPTTLVAKSLGRPRMTRILPRGNWLDETGEVVEPSVPQFLPHEPIEGRRATRLDLAKWIMADDNPLTARTFVNRLWKLFYGQGLSRNLDDLGGQGEAPSHPELLDWLAAEFRDSGWDVKHLVKLMVSSETYRQSSVPSDELLAKDPTNRLVGRQGRWRLEAEFVRDTALSVSGLLVNKTIGGPSVKPYQPDGYWQHLNFPKRQWKSDSGNDLYRRGLYTFWCRTFLHPSMLAFDAPSREECTAERARSNIPQQALVLLNDPVFVEASRVFAQRIISSSSGIEERIDWAMRQAMSRPPTESEMMVLRSLCVDQLSRYADSPQEAEAFAGVGSSLRDKDVRQSELAAWTQVARAILNAYETTSRY